MRNLSLAMLCAFLTGCFTMRAPLPGVLRADISQSVEVVGHFDTTFTHYYVLHGAFGAPEEDLIARALLQKVNAAHADGVANVTVETSFGLTGVALALATGSLLHPRTYHLQGDLVRIHAAALPGRPLLELAAAH